MNFKDFWKIQGGYVIEKAALTASELKSVQKTIAELQAKRLPSSKIIAHLQTINKKLAEQWKAERAYWTEVKRSESDSIKSAGDDLDVEKYRIILSPNPCPICKAFADGGRRRFTMRQLVYKGREAPPVHPNCFCILLPA